MGSDEAFGPPIPHHAGEPSNIQLIWKEIYALRDKVHTLSNQVMMIEVLKQDVKEVRTDLKEQTVQLAGTIKEHASKLADKITAEVGGLRRDLDDHKQSGVRRREAAVTEGRTHYRWKVGLVAGFLFIVTSAAFSLVIRAIFG